VSWPARTLVCSVLVHDGCAQGRADLSLGPSSANVGLDLHLQSPPFRHSTYASVSAQFTQGAQAIESRFMAQEARKRASAARKQAPADTCPLLARPVIGPTFAKLAKHAVSSAALVIGKPVVEPTIGMSLLWIPPGRFLSLFRTRIPIRALLFRLFQLLCGHGED
jgi:hypothetical protein